MVRTTDTHQGARAANVILGVWLFLTAFFWTHYGAQYTNTWLIGAAIAVVALIGFRAPMVRWLNTVLAAWLIASVWILDPITGATFWNNLIVGVLSLLVSLVPAGTTRVATSRGTAQTTTGRWKHSPH